MCSVGNVAYLIGRWILDQKVRPCVEVLGKLLNQSSSNGCEVEHKEAELYILCLAQALEVARILQRGDETATII